MTTGLKKFKSKFLPRLVRDYIKYPKDSFMGNLFRYSSAVILGLIASLIIIALPQPEGKTIFYLVFLLASLAGIYIGGSLSGIIVVAIGVVSSYFFLYRFTINPFQILEICLFVITGLTMGMVIDFFRRVPILNELKKREKQYYQDVITLEESMQKAEKEIRQRDEFLSIASHELKTPLTSMLMQIQFAVHNIKNVSLANFSVQNLLEMLESVEHQTERLSKMINDLLNISLITTGKIAIEPEKVNLSDIMNEAVEKIPSSMNKEHYPIRTQIRKKLIGRWDKVRIEQVVSNLITNAIKYGNNKPVEVSLIKSLNTARIIVHDNGIGIPKEEQKKIFALFERGRNTKKRGGLGVGLYITNQIVKAHKGKLSFKSKEGKGSTFLVELPLDAFGRKSH